MQGIASKNAPSANVVVPHFLLGAITLLSAMLILLWHPEILTSHYFNYKLLSLTHLLVLGWMCMVIFGALYQLVPVILEVKLYSEKLAIFCLCGLFCSAIMLAIAFWQYEMGHFFHITALIVFLTVFVFALNLFLTAKQSTFIGIERRFILTAIFWLVFTVSAGITLGLNLQLGFLKNPHIELLKLHAHAGIVGWFLQLIIGVSSRLLPMFMVSHDLDKRKLERAYYLINISLVVLIFAFYFSLIYLLIIAGFTMIIGILLFILFQVQAYKNRVKPALDIGMTQSAMAFLVLIPILAISTLLIGGWSFSDEIIQRFSLVYGLCIFLGFISSLIMGQSYKTLPFIVWLHKYRHVIGKQKIPMPKDLYNEGIAYWQLMLFYLGFIPLIVAVLLATNMGIQLASGIVTLSVLLYVINLIRIVFFKQKVLYGNN